MTSIHTSIAAAKAKWDAFQRLSPENERRLWQKLRLEWNYHSNHIEGNTLTYGETELLLIHGATHGNHILREYQEMQAHDVGIAHLRELAEDRTRFIGETDIRNLNKIILKEPFWKSAQTADGQASRKQIIPGEYKTTPNNVLTATGELFEFAAPLDVPAKMQELVQWLVHALSAENPPILPILAKLHHDFVLIHPFDDGNGRVARMLVNYVLMRKGLPPIIVPTERKRDYLNALRLADAGDITELESFLGACVVRSLELGIKAARGESLDEPGDVEKEVALFVKSRAIRDKPELTRSPELVAGPLRAGLHYLLTRMEDKIRMFQPLFAKVSLFTEPLGIQEDGSTLAVFEYCLQKGVDQNSWMMWHFEFDGYLGNANHSFGVNVWVALNFDELEYVWKIDGIPKLRKPYSEVVSIVDADAFVEQVLKTVMDSIKKQSGED
jgi:Fic family protein